MFSFLQQLWVCPRLHLPERAPAAGLLHQREAPRPPSPAPPEERTLNGMPTASPYQTTTITVCPFDLKLRKSVSLLSVAVCALRALGWNRMPARRGLRGLFCPEVWQTHGHSPPRLTLYLPTCSPPQNFVRRCVPGPVSPSTEQRLISSYHPSLNISPLIDSTFTFDAAPPFPSSQAKKPQPKRNLLVQSPLYRHVTPPPKEWHSPAVSATSWEFHHSLEGCCCCCCCCCCGGGAET